MFLLKPRHARAAATASTTAAATSGPSPPAPSSVTEGHSPFPLDAREWKYVAEGGANVLFRHHPRGDGDEREELRRRFHGKLLRVKKCDIADGPARKHASGSSNSSGHKKKRPKKPHHGHTPYNAHYPHPMQVLQYATEDILPHLVEQVGPYPSRDQDKSDEIKCYEQVAELLEVERRFLVELNEQLLQLETRPAHRRQSQIDVGLACVMVLPDVTLPPPDDNPLAFFDESVDLEDVPSSSSSSGSSSASSSPPPEREDLTDEQLFDQETAAIGDEETGDELVVSDKPRDSDTRSTDESTTTSSDNDDEEVPALVSPPLPPRRRRVLSGNCNIFDCCFRNICVEIKPKIGFKPQGPLIPEAKQRVCRFCMHQHYKRATKKVEEISEYCPLDLFSRDDTRVRKALRDLQRTPQNNFKVFVRSNDDEVVNVITGLNADALPKGAAQAKYSCRRKRMGFRHSCQSIGAETDLHLLDDALSAMAASGDDRLLPDVVELLTEVLLKLDILEDLKKMQLLDHITVDGVWHLQQLLQRVRAVVPEAAPSNDESSWRLGDLVERLRLVDARERDEDIEVPGSLRRCLEFLALALTQVPGLEGLDGVRKWEELRLAAFESLYQQLVRRFHVATTLKDCSLLLCLRRCEGDEDGARTTRTATPVAHCCPAGTRGRAPSVRFDHLREYEHRIEFRDMVFNCVIAVVDLDVKSHKSVDDYYRLDDKILQHFVQKVENGGVAGGANGGFLHCCQQQDADACAASRSG